MEIGAHAYRLGTPNALVAVYMVSGIRVECSWLHPIRIKSNVTAFSQSVADVFGCFQIRAVFSTIETNGLNMFVVAIQNANYAYMMALWLVRNAVVVSDGRLSCDCKSV